MKRRKRIIAVTLGILILGISGVYAATIINSKDVLYDTSKSNGTSSNVQGALDELYSKIGDTCSTSGTNKRGTNIIDYITNLAKTDTTNLVYDDTNDKNLRYIGSNPNNYVYFNDELWRIIGVMNNVKDADGNSASRIKLIKDASIGAMAWDTSNINNWSKASLQKLLNSGDYYNKSGSYSATGLKDEAKSMISNIVWSLGGINTSNRTANVAYQSERSSSVYGSNPTTWTGNVGLMYPSDFGYAVGGNERNSCLNSNMGDSTGTYINCANNTWIFNKTYKWTITQQTEFSYGVFPLNGNGWIGSWYAKGIYYYANYSYNVHPVVYLNTNISRVGGTGSSDDPYIITNKVVSNDESNASHAKLDDEGKLIPVTLAADGKATYVSEDDEDWYNYSEKKWANVVILIDSPSKTYKEGDIIFENDIESYFVWIPKYKYKLWNTGTASKNAHEIDIVFDTKDTTDVEGVSCKTPMTSGATGNCDNGEYMTHPAFISLGVDGFWVGKFETGYKGATSTSGAEANSSDFSKIVVKPNVYSWRSNNVYNFFVSTYNYERDLDSHMMKNTEWGAVAYLSHSKYGINREVNINNNSSYKTGYSAIASTNQLIYPGTYGDGSSYNQMYNTEIGHLASTTGNITGIYDMNGGSFEYMASYISGKSVSSGFSTTTLANYDAKYFDIYDARSAATTYQYRILGDATEEMGPFENFQDGDGTDRYHNSWYSDLSHFVMSTNPWFTRGGFYNYGILTGQFLFGRHTGSSDIRISSRIVLTG